MTVSKDLIGILGCPKCKGNLKEEGMFLVCNKCKVAYPVLEDVPDMLIEDAWKLEKARRVKFKHAKIIVVI